MGTLAVACVLAAWPAVFAEDAVEWHTRIPGALETASESRKPILMDVWAIWCEPCKRMDQTTYRDERVVRALADFIPLKVDADRNEVFLQRYEIDGMPTTLIVDGTGDEIARLVGLVDAEALLRALEQVRAGYESYLEDVASADDTRALRDAASYLMRVGNPDRAARLLRDASKVAKGSDAERQVIDLELADALLEAGREGAAVKTLKRLAGGAASDDLRGRALLALFRAELARGRKASADEALALLREEYPALVPAVDTSLAD